jgi:hypothetical protein
MRKFWQLQQLHLLLVYQSLLREVLLRQGELPLIGLMYISVLVSFYLLETRLRDAVGTYRMGV